MLHWYWNDLLFRITEVVLNYWAYTFSALKLKNVELLCSLCVWYSCWRLCFYTVYKLLQVHLVLDSFKKVELGVKNVWITTERQALLSGKELFTLVLYRTVVKPYLYKFVNYPLNVFNLVVDTFSYNGNSFYKYWVCVYYAELILEKLLL